MDTSHVVAGAELKRLQFRSRFWWVGWVLTLLTFIGVVHFFSRVQAMREMLTEIRQLQNDARDIQHEQQTTTDAFVRAWGDQQRTTQLVIDIGNYVKQRQEQVDQNRGMPMRMPK